MKLKNIPESITFTLSYSNKNLSVIVKRFKKLRYLKDKAYQLFYPIKSDVKLKYNNKDLTSLLDQSVGLIFENKGKVKLGIEPIIGTKRPINKRSQLNSKKNLLGENEEEEDSKYKALQTEALNNNFNSSSALNSGRQKLPPIKNKNKNSAKNFDITSYKICRECLSNDTNYYCRNCDIFLCPKCFNKKHKKHQYLETDINDEKSNVDKYKEEINNSLFSTFNNLDNLSNVVKNDVNFEEWKKKYYDSVNKLTQIANYQKEEIKNNDNKEDNSGDSNDGKMEYQNNLDKEKEILNNIDISTDKDPFQLFKDINKEERLINQTLKKGKNKSNQIEEMFVSIENEIDNILFDLEEQLSVKE